MGGECFDDFFPLFKLHFELADMTQLLLVRVGVDFVFPGHKKKKNDRDLILDCCEISEKQAWAELGRAQVKL